MTSAMPAGRPRRRVNGMVEDFSNQKVSGWVAVKPGAPPLRVSLLVNDVEIAATWATSANTNRRSHGEVRGFGFRLHDIWMYVTPDDRLTVQVKGQPLPISIHGMFRQPTDVGTEPLATLQARLEAGYVFSNSGILQLSKQLDTDWQRRIMALYDEVRRIVADVHGHQMFLMYGSLLGAVREGGVIGHDIDFDTAFISAHTTGPESGRELQQIAFTLIKHGLDVECLSTSLHLHSTHDPDVRINLFHLYFNESGLLQVPHGIAGTTEIRAADWTGTTTIDFAGGRADIPVNAEAWVEHLYGSGWRKPQPGFDWDAERVSQDLTGHHEPEWCEEVYWTNFYSRMDYPNPSPFFETVNARPDLPATIIDIGCGDGRDACGFGLAGRRVLGLDRSPVAVEHATAKAAAMQLAESVEFRACDVSDRDSVTTILGAAIAGSPDAPVMFYLRFFLHSISERVQDELMAVIASVARPGDQFAAEFRTDADETRTKVHTRHYRRFQNGPAFGARLAEDYSFTVVDETEGTGLAPYLEEDPAIYRVIGKR